MERVDNPELKNRILKHLASIYKIDEVREPNHLSSYVYCRTKTFFEQKQATEATEQEVMLFVLGYGLQDILTPKSADTPLYEKDGIIYRPDMSFKMDTAEAEQLAELKTTRKSARSHYDEDSIPETWLMYMKGGCYIRGTNTYDLIVLYMMGNYAPPFPQLYADRITFTDEELSANWNIILANKKVLDDSLKTNIPPMPHKNCLEWECKYCRFKLICESLAIKE